MAQYLRGAPSPKIRKERLATSVDDAVAAKDLDLVKAETAAPEDLISETLKRIGERPILVVDPAHQVVLAGVLTSSDVL